MTRKELIVEVSERADINRDVVQQVLDAFADVARECVVRGEEVPLGIKLGKLTKGRRGVRFYLSPQLYQVMHEV